MLSISWHQGLNQNNLFSFFLSDSMPPSYPRSRYIAFRIILKDSESIQGFTRAEMIETLKQQCLKQFQTPCKTFDIFLTRFQCLKGIVRCYHTEKDRTIHLLRGISSIHSIPVHVETIGTSGTIKSCCKKFFMGDSLK